MKNAKHCWAMGLILSSAAAVGCGEAPGTDEPGTGEPGTVVETGAALTSATSYYDDSAAPAHFMVRVCTSAPAEHPAVDCMVDWNYALVGGGAWAQYTGSGAMLTESYPKSDGRTWHASSQDNVWFDSHPVEAYAIGLRLDGINVEVLRGSVLSRHRQATVPASPVSWPSGSASVNFLFDPASKLLGGGVAATTTGPGQYLTSTRALDGTTWSAASKDHWNPSVGQVVVHALGLQMHQLLLRGYGVDVAQRIGFGTEVSSGLGSSPGWVSQGWALTSIGGQTTFPSGAGRMLTRVGIYRGPSSDDFRQVVAESIDHGEATAGTTTVAWTEVRKTPGSHSICNQGGPLNASTADWCVSNICAQRPSCCQSSWDATCVAQVTSICGDSCSNYTCSQPSVHLSFWSDGAASGSTRQVKNNCYNYATNTPSSIDPFPSTPGRFAGYPGCDVGYDDDGNVIPDPSCYNTANFSRRAAADGLIPTTLAQGCTDGRSLVALAIQPGMDYHWYRRDSNGFWSHKRGTNPPKTVDDPPPGIAPKAISNPETAYRGLYTEFGGYFCTCSSSTEGAGHAVIK